MEKRLEEKLERLAQDKLLLDAIGILLNQEIEKECPEVNENIDNNVIGEKYRAYQKTKDIVRCFFDTLTTYDINNNNNKSFNKAK